MQRIGRTGDLVVTVDRDVLTTHMEIKVDLGNIQVVV